jgi:hypothetical protein
MNCVRGLNGCSPWIATIDSPADALCMVRRIALEYKERDSGSPEL